jgi:uncharacterized Rmd1/YagE family protein
MLTGRVCLHFAEYFTGLVRALEVRQRVHDLNSKISHAQEVHTILKDLLTEVRFPHGPF